MNGRAARTSSRVEPARRDMMPDGGTRRERRVQRSCACGGTCSDCLRRPRVQRWAETGVGGAGGAVRGGANHAEGGAASASTTWAHVERVVSQPGHPLDPNVRASIEHLLGHDFSRVRIHDDHNASESAAALGARAYATGEHVVFGDARYAPQTRSGQELLLHELVHVVQQSGARPLDGGRTGVPADRRVNARVTAHLPRARGDSVLPDAPDSASEREAQRVSATALRRADESPDPITLPSFMDLFRSSHRATANR